MNRVNIRYHVHSLHSFTEKQRGFSSDLSNLLQSVTDSIHADSFSVRQYLRSVFKLEAFIGRNAVLSVCSLEDSENVGSAYYILSEAIYCHHRGLKDRDRGFEYVCKALSVFIECNKKAADCGFFVERTSKMEDAMEAMPWRHSEIVEGSFGVYWREIVCVLLLRGEMLMDSEQFESAQNNYQFAYNLVCSVDVKGDGVAMDVKNKYLRQCLEHLTILHCYQKNYVLSVHFGKQFVHRLNSKLVSSKQMIEAKAWLACNLMHCPDDEDKDEGARIYEAVLRYFCVSTWTESECIHL